MSGSRLYILRQRKVEDRYNVAGVASGYIECAGYEWGSFRYIGTEEGWRIGTTWRVWPVDTSSVRGMSGGCLYIYIYIRTEEGWRIGTTWQV